MNIPLLMASIFLSGSALFDGISTVRFRKNPAYEEQNILFGKRPSKLRVYLEGTGIIAAELGLGLLVNHVSPWLGYAAAIAFGVQGYLHVRYAINNFKLPV